LAAHLSADHVLTRAQVAERLSVSLYTIDRWRKIGKGPRWFRVGWAAFYDQAEVERFPTGCSGQLPRVLRLICAHYDHLERAVPALAGGRADGPRSREGSFHKHIPSSLVCPWLATAEVIASSACL
jgi:hypothetical protein